MRRASASLAGWSAFPIRMHEPGDPCPSQTKAGGSVAAAANPLQEGLLQLPLLPLLFLACPKIVVAVTNLKI